MGEFTHRALPNFPETFIALGAVHEEEHDRRAVHQWQKIINKIQRGLIQPLEIVNGDNQRLIYLAARQFEQAPQSHKGAALQGFAFEIAHPFAQFIVERQAQKVDDKRQDGQQSPRGEVFQKRRADFVHGHFVAIIGAHPQQLPHDVLHWHIRHRLGERLAATFGPAIRARIFLLQQLL